MLTEDLPLSDEQLNGIPVKTYSAGFAETTVELNMALQKKASPCRTMIADSMKYLLLHNS